MRRALIALGVATLVGAGAVASGEPAAAGSALSGVTQLSAGRVHACAVLADTTAVCWGRNGRGQVGDGNSDTNAGVPHVVLDPAGSAPLTGVTQISAGDSLTCAVVSGQAMCWGSNASHQLGDGSGGGLGDFRHLPGPVSNPAGTGPLAGVTQVAAGSRHACARLSNGQAVCWGANDWGNLGDGTTTARSRPVAVSNPTGTGPLTGVAAISVHVEALNESTCAVLTSGQARCWGDNFDGDLGDGTTTQRLRPVAVRNPSNTGPLTGVVEVDAVRTHRCARLANGQARCWAGRDNNGQQGDGDFTDDPPDLLPRPVRNPAGTANLGGVEELTAGASHTCAALSSGRARCWGLASAGQLGSNGTRAKSLPVPVLNESGTGPLTGVVDVEAGGSYSCALMASTEIRCWGDNSSGQAGNGSGIHNHFLPVAVASPAAVT